MAKLREENQGLREEKLSQQVVQEKLQSENGELWAQLQQHKQQIESLGRDLREMQKRAGLTSSTLDPGSAERTVVRGWDWPEEEPLMQATLIEISPASPERTSKAFVAPPQAVPAMVPQIPDAPPQVVPALVPQIPDREKDLVAHLQHLKAQMVTVEEQGESLRAATKVIEKEYSRIYQDNSAFCTSALSAAGSAVIRAEDERQVEYLPNGADVVQLPPISGSAVQISNGAAAAEALESLRKTAKEVMSGRKEGPMVQFNSNGSPTSTGTATPKEKMLNGASNVEATINERCSSMPPSSFFDPVRLGQNLALSADGAIATRIRGCRQSVALGCQVLTCGSDGCWFFALEILETVPGWVSGLGIGVTRTHPTELRNVPDKAWRIPGTVIAGYWGRAFCEGREYRIPWRADQLCRGDKIACLLTAHGAFAIFVNSKRVVWFDSGFKFQDPSKASFYAVVDVFAAAKSVRWVEDPALPMGALDRCLECPPVISPLQSARRSKSKEAFDSNQSRQSDYYNQ